MGRKTRGVYPDKEGSWQVDKWFKGTRLRQRGFASAAEAESWLIKRLGELQAVKIHGERPPRTFDEAAAHYLATHMDKVSIATDTYMLQGLMPYIGTLQLHQVHDATLAPFVQARLAEGRSHKTVNLALGAVRQILRLAASAWRDESGTTWLSHAPTITMLPLAGHQRPPRPILWTEQERLLSCMPAHLRRMSLFALNTGARDNVVCNLRWDWEIKVPELGISVFEVPSEHVKGRKTSKVLVLNSVAQSIIEDCRGRHDEFVFVWRRERVRNFDQPAAMSYAPIETMNNTAWQRARVKAGLDDLHVHDLRHTVGMRLREADVRESTIADLLWHSRPSMTHHYSMAQLVELHAALEGIREPTGRWNRSLATLRREQEAANGEVSPPKVPQARKRA